MNRNGSVNKIYISEKDLVFYTFDVVELDCRFLFIVIIEL